MKTIIAKIENGRFRVDEIRNTEYAHVCHYGAFIAFPCISPVKKGQFINPRAEVDRIFCLIRSVNSIWGNNEISK